MVQQDVKYKKGVTLTQHPNPITGVADIVTVTFDLRALQIQDSMQQQGIIGVPTYNPPKQSQGTPTPPNTVVGQ